MTEIATCTRCERARSARPGAPLPRKIVQNVKHKLDEVQHVVVRAFAALIRCGRGHEDQIAFKRSTSSTVTSMWNCCPRSESGHAGGW